MDKLIITAAISGAEVTKEHNPAVPYTKEELAREALSAYEAGASIIHLHVREDNGAPTQSKEKYEAAIQEIRKLCPDVIIQPSTGGSVGMTTAERAQPLELAPEMATLTSGSVNFGGDAVFMNDEVMVTEFAELMKKNGVKPEIEIFDVAMVETAIKLAKKGHLENPMHFNLVMGVPGAISANLRNFSYLVDSLPENATFTTSGIGRFQFQMAMLSIAAGGHVRVGFEDNIYLEKGVLANSNGQLVERVVTMAKAFGREVATPAEARKILGLGS